MWPCFKMWLVLNFINIISAEWVEIKQYSNRKTYIVTPHSPYVYGPSMFAPSTTSSYETLITPNIYSEQKKPISKLPDAVLKNILTTESNFRITTLRPPKVRSNSTKHQSYNRKNFKIIKPPMTSTYRPTPKISQVYHDEQEYEESLEYYDDDESYVEDDGEKEMAVDDELGDSSEYYDEGEYEYVEYDQPEKQETKKGDSGGFTYLGLMPYLQNIQSSLIQNSHEGVDGKVSFLTEIKNRLLYTIKQKIATLWSSGSSRRSARSTRDDNLPAWEKSDHDMHFPSNEGALLTLGFLTFAVFLIKSILKLIHGLKGVKGGYYHPHGNIAIMVVPGSSTSTSTTMAPMMMMMGKRKRSIQQSEALNVLNMIDNYKYVS